jgi:hypothetical protein
LSICSGVVFAICSCAEVGERQSTRYFDRGAPVEGDVLEFMAIPGME